MYCRYCGKQLPEGSAFCTYCGKQLQEKPSQQSDPTGPMPPPVQQVQPHILVPQKKKRKKWPIVLGSLFGALVLLVIVGNVSGYMIRQAESRKRLDEKARLNDIIQNAKEKESVSEWLEKHSSSATESIADTKKTAEQTPESEAEPTPEPEPEQTALDLEIPPSSTSALLPDLGLYLDCARHEDQPCDDGDGWYLSYSYADDGGTAADEVLALLQQGRYQLRLDLFSEEDFDNYSPLIDRCYFFSYIGGASVETLVDDLVPLTHDDISEDVDYHVCLSVQRHTDTGRILLSVRYGNSFTLEDPEVRGTAVNGMDGDSGLSGSAAGTQNGTSSRSGTKIKTPCRKCFGNKTIDCDRCGGDGKIEDYVQVPNYSGEEMGSKWVEKTCPVSNCYHGKVPCPRCDGTGDEP